MRLKAFCVCVCLFWSLRAVEALQATPSHLHHQPPLASISSPHFVLIGGLGKIGTSVAEHLLLKEPECRVTLVARHDSSQRRKRDSILQQVMNDPRVSVVSLQQNVNIWKWPPAVNSQDDQLQDLIDSCDCVIHTAGPYYVDQPPAILRRVLESKQCKVYVDVSDPLEYLQASLSHHEKAVMRNKTCIVAAGAFPGMSNVLAMEAASALLQEVSSDLKVPSEHDGVHNVYFQYFTSGQLRAYESLSGRLLGRVNFNNSLVGTQQVFAWPFPEAATVPQALNATGNSVAAMGTAPDVWNSMLGMLVAIVPRAWWRSRTFSQFMADFSQPLVFLTDAYLRAQDAEHKTGETHAMRIDVTRRCLRSKMKVRTEVGRKDGLNAKRLGKL
ncbi:hypothetical protein MPSEU_000265600 [Mayamaea pseudoterrestris]|nr:hypothetical protein MPSEU_000265600 [Mayamaea pseudoterrestris]